MELLELMRTRRSIRKYEQKDVEDRMVERILQAGMLSESGKAIRPWEFVVVKDKDILQKLSDCRAGSVGMLKEAAVAIAVLGNTDATDVWVEDCSVAMANMHLMAHELGLGSCWIQGRLRKANDGRDTNDFVRDILNYPENYQLEAILSVGYPNEAKEGYDLISLPTNKIHINSFNKEEK